MKLLSSLLTTSMTIPSLVSPLSVMVNNAGSTNLKESKTILDDITNNPNLQLKKLIETTFEGDSEPYGKKVINQWIDSSIKSHNVYQNYFRDEDWGIDDWKESWDTNLDFTNDSYLKNELKSNLDPDTNLPIVPIMNGKFGEETGEHRTLATIDDFLSSANLPQYIADVDSKVTYGDYSFSGAKGKIHSNAYDCIGWHNHNDGGVHVFDDSTGAGDYGQAYPLFAKRDGHFGPKTLYVWDWRHSLETMRPHYNNTLESKLEINSSSPTFTEDYWVKSFDQTLPIEERGSLNRIIDRKRNYVFTMKKNWIQNILNDNFQNDGRSQSIMVEGSDTASEWSQAHIFGPVENNKQGMERMEQRFRFAIPLTTKFTVNHRNGTWCVTSKHGGWLSYSPDDTDPSWLSMLNYKIDDLIQLDKVGFDKDQNKYFTTSCINKDIIAGALGMFYQQEFIDNVFNIDFAGISGQSVDYKDQWMTMGNSFYYNSICGINGNRKGGVYTWADNSKGKWNKSDYDNWIIQLKQWLYDKINSTEHSVSFDNYFLIKDYVSSQASGYNRLVTTEELEPMVTEGILQNNGWAKSIEYYGITDKTLNQLIILLPQLKISEWDMEADDEEHKDFTNPLQMEVQGERQNGDVYYSTGLDLLEPNKNKHYLRNIELDNENNIVFMHNAKVLEDAYSAHKNVQGDDTKEMDGDYSYFEPSIHGIETLELATLGNVSRTSATWTGEAGHQFTTWNAFEIQKEGRGIATGDDLSALGARLQIKVKPELLEDNVVNVWNNAMEATSQDPIKALQQIYFNDIKNDERIPASPFVEYNLYDPEDISYDLEVLKDHPQYSINVIADSNMGTLTSQILYQEDEESEKQVVVQYQSTGFNSALPPGPDPEHMGLSAGAIAGISAGSVVAAGAGTFGIVKGVQYSKNKKRDKEFDELTKNAKKK